MAVHEDKCKHGKSPYTEKDMAAYESRPQCTDKGDCDCYLCSRVCWAGECRPKRPTRTP